MPSAEELKTDLAWVAERPTNSRTSIGGQLSANDWWTDDGALERLSEFLDYEAQSGLASQLASLPDYEGPQLEWLDALLAALSAAPEEDGAAEGETEEQAAEWDAAWQMYRKPRGNDWVFADRADAPANDWLTQEQAVQRRNAN